MREKIAVILCFLLLTVPFKSHSQEKDIASDYLKVLKEKGQEPVDFVNNILVDHNLIIFDDALHLAKEPFDFYQKLIKDSTFKSKVKFIFIEVFSIASQEYIDEYFNKSVKDSLVLLPVFQNDYTGYGWRYKTYLDLLSTIWDVNSQLSESEKIKVVCVDQPIFWEAIHTQKDYQVFQQSAIARDYFMYKTISQTLNNFENNDKGIFLTNTRHAYKHIKDSNNELYWNTGTFLNQWHPGKSYSIRIHNVNLSIQSIKDNVSNHTTEGLDRLSYSWIKMENGVWEKAFKENGNIPVAIPLEDNVFGKADYVGNHMVNVADGQTMYDAYDGLIFLAPLEELHFSAQVDFIYTESFIEELKRRITLVQGEQLPEFLANNKADSLDDFIKKIIQFQEQKKNTLVPNDTY